MITRKENKMKTREEILTKERLEYVRAEREKHRNEAFEAARAEVLDTDFGKYRELLTALLAQALVEEAKNAERSLALGDEVVGGVALSGNDNDDVIASLVGFGNDLCHVHNAFGVGNR